MGIGQAIRKARLERGVTLEAVALAAGTDAANLSRIERDLQGFSKDMIERVAHALGMPLSTLYLRAEQEVPEYRVASTVTDDAFEPFRKWLGRLTPENRVLALEFVKLLHRQQENRAPREESSP